MPNLIGEERGDCFYDTTPCDICGEPLAEDGGEFWDEIKKESVIAHAQCGLDAGLPLA